MLEHSDVPVFITTDTLLHVYHIQFDETLKEIEEDEFFGDAQRLTAALLADAEDGLVNQQKEEDALERLKRERAEQVISMSYQQSPVQYDYNYNGDLIKTYDWQDNKNDVYDDYRNNNYEKNNDGFVDYRYDSRGRDDFRQDNNNYVSNNSNYQNNYNNNYPTQTYGDQRYQNDNARNEDCQYAPSGYRLNENNSSNSDRWGNNGYEDYRQNNYQDIGVQYYRFDREKNAIVPMTAY